MVASQPQHAVAAAGALQSPYLLPCAVAGLANVLVFAAGLLLLDETNLLARQNRANGGDGDDAVRQPLLPAGRGPEPAAAAAPPSLKTYGSVSVRAPLLCIASGGYVFPPAPRLLTCALTRRRPDY